MVFTTGDIIVLNQCGVWIICTKLHCGFDLNLDSKGTINREKFQSQALIHLRLIASSRSLIHALGSPEN